MRIFARPHCGVLIPNVMGLRPTVRFAAMLALLMLPHVAMAVPALPEVKHAGWQEACGSCHMLYHPGLLPARSWQRIMDELKRHFGRNVGLDKALRDDITAFLIANAADHSTSKLSQDITQSLSPTDRPTRISTTRWFGTAHASIRKVEHFDQCFICHRHAQAGDFVVAH